jgi:hypothetical protein
VWLRATAGAAVPLFVFIVVSTLRHDRRLGIDFDPVLIAVLIVGACVWSIAGSLFLVGIPLRFAQNVMFTQRRRACRTETIALVIAFIAMWLALFAMFKYPGEG